MLLLVGLGRPAQTNEALADPAGDSFGIQLLDAPVSRQADPRALRYIVDHLAPGTTILRRVLVVNRAAAALQVDVYPAAAAVEQQQFEMGADHATNELVTWTSVDHSQLQLPPGGQAPIVVKIAVPATASPGERYGVVWASATFRSAAANITRVDRVGVRMYLDIGPGGEPVSSFTIGQILPVRDPQGDPSMRIAVRNTGVNIHPQPGPGQVTAPDTRALGPCRDVRFLMISVGA